MQLINLYSINKSINYDCDLEFSLFIIERINIIFYFITITEFETKLWNHWSNNENTILGNICVDLQFAMGPCTIVFAILLVKAVLLDGFNHHSFRYNPSLRSTKICPNRDRWVKLFSSPSRQRPLKQPDRTQKDNLQKSGSVILRSIEDVFNSAATDVDKVNAIKVIVAVEADVLNEIHASSMIRYCVKNRIDITQILRLDTLLKLLNKRAVKLIWLARDISPMLSCLKLIPSNDPILNDYLLFVKDILEKCPDEFTGRDIGMSLHGFQTVSHPLNNVQLKILALLSRKIELCKELKPVDISNALFGLRRISSEHPIVKQILSLLNQKIINCTDSFGSHEIGNSFNGLQCMSEYDPEVLAIIKSLTSKTRDMKQPLFQRSVGSAVMGLRNFSSDSFEVRDLLSAISEKFSCSNDTIIEISISSCFNGLRCMNETLEVQKFVKVITQKVNELPSTIKISAKSFANSMTGFRNMNGKVNSTRNAIKALSERLDDASSFGSLDIGRAFTGLQGISHDNAYVLSVLEKLSKIVSRTRMKLTDIALSLYSFKSQAKLYPESSSVLLALVGQLTSLDMKMDPREISMSLTGLQGLSTEYSEVIEVAKSLTPFVGKFDAQACGNSLAGMKMMSADIQEVRDLLTTVTNAIRDCKEAMSALEFALAYNGLQNMDSKYPEVLTTLKVINDKFEESNVQLSVAGISMALFGLQSMSSDDSYQVKRTLDLMSRQIEINQEPFQPSDISDAIFGEFECIEKF